DGGRPSGPRPVGPVVAGGLARDPMAGARREGSTNGASVPAGQAKPGFTPTGARIGRNDPCWCESGQKYKKCHGR
ncbi:MAG: SEC-C metal-binding domain-containing protein, partial [Chloroflexota bacterium]|nr:SEC-C metal-binding domain-containing protein [Chloroflexota bacterium]